MSNCSNCGDPLTLEIEADDNDLDVGSSSASNPVKTVPDDVELSCGCHFHWQCLIDSYEIRQCPSCNRDISSSSPTDGQQILCNLHNEGGLQERLDIMPLLTEEAYLRAYPEDRKCRAFLEFCREGDLQAVVDLLKDDDDDDEEDEDEEMDDEPSRPKKTAEEILRYQDSIGDMQSGLHAAVTGGSREVAWLLLLLASDLPELDIPALVYQEAATLGIMREDQTGKVDIRSLRDGQGRSAEQLAAAAGPIWSGWVGNGRLAI